MIAMHYAIGLPSDYDMEIIRRRVRDNGHKTDSFRGLAMKAYLIAEKGKYRNTRNQYAPFYVWQTVEGMSEFLLHGPFDNILHSFGCPPVRTWFVIHAHIRKLTSLLVACIDTALISPYTDFAGIINDEKKAATACFAESCSVVSAYNPGNWELCRFNMMPLERDIGTMPSNKLLYDVHHIS